MSALPSICIPVLLAVLVPPAALGQLEAQPSSVDFGDRGQNERPEAEVVLRNGGQNPVVVREVKKSCDCISIAPQPVNAAIPAGGRLTLRISMGSGRAMGRLDKWITVVTNGRIRPDLKIPVAMRVLEGFEVEPREVRFEGVVGGAPSTASVDVKARPGRTQVPVLLEVKGILGRFNRPSDRHLRASVSPIPGGQRLTIQLDPHHPEGPISAELEATLNGKSLFIPIGGDMFAWIKVSPNYINFSRAIEGDPSSTVREVTLSSTDGTPFRVLGIEYRPVREGEKSARLEFSVGSVNAFPSPPATVQKISCRASFSQGKERTFFGTATIRTDHPKKPEILLKYSGFFAEPPPPRPAPGGKVQR